MLVKSRNTFEFVRFLIFAHRLQWKGMAYPATQGKEALDVNGCCLKYSRHSGKLLGPPALHSAVGLKRGGYIRTASLANS